MFHVSIGNEENKEMHAFDPHAPEIKYVQDDENTCCLGSLASDLFDVNEYVVEHDVVHRISPYLSCYNVDFKNSIKFTVIL